MRENVNIETDGVCISYSAITLTQLRKQPQSCWHASLLPLLRLVQLQPEAQRRRLLRGRCSIRVYHEKGTRQCILVSKHCNGYIRDWKKYAHIGELVAEIGRQFVLFQPGVSGVVSLRICNCKVCVNFDSHIQLEYHHKEE